MSITYHWKKRIINPRKCPQYICKSNFPNMTTLHIHTKTKLCHRHSWKFPVARSRRRLLLAKSKNGLWKVDDHKYWVLAGTNASTKKFDEIAIGMHLAIY